MNKVYRSGISLKSIFTGMNSAIPPGYEEDRFALAPQRSWLNRTLRAILRPFYHSTKSLARPVLFRLRRYFTGDIQQEMTVLRGQTEEMTRQMLALSKKIESLAQAIDSIKKDN